MAFSFNQNKPTFGTGSGTSTGFGTTGTGFGFGSGAASTTTSTGFGFGNTSTTSTGNAFGATNTGFGGFGASTATTTASTGFGGFGASAPTSSTAGFGGFGTTTSTSGGGSLFGGFGNQTSTASSGFGGFGTGTASTGFGTGTGTLGGAFGTGLGQTQAQQQANQQQNQTTQLTNMAAAVSMPQIFGDERDNIIAKWNQLQAFWGTGKAFFDQAGNSVPFGPENPFCRFKAVGYCCMPSYRNADGLVSIVFPRPQSEVTAQQTQAVDALHKILGSKPNLSVCVDSVKSLIDDKTEMTIYIQERQQTGSTKRITAQELYNFFNQANTKQQLTSLGVEKCYPKTGLSKDHLKQYLDSTPQGIDPLIWQQAKLDNPDPDKLLPVPIVGFNELHNRLKLQEQQTELHTSTLQMINNDIATLQRNHSDMLSKTEEYKRNFLTLSHRVLKVLVKQEVHRKLGLGIHGDEEQLRVQLENIQTELNAPTQFKGRLNELMSQIRMQNQLGVMRSDAQYQIDENVQHDIQLHLKQQQQGLQHLISIIKDDLSDLKLIEQGYAEATTQRR